MEFKDSISDEETIDVDEEDPNLLDIFEKKIEGLRNEMIKKTEGVEKKINEDIQKKMTKIEADIEIKGLRDEMTKKMEDMEKNINEDIQEQITKKIEAEINKVKQDPEKINKDTEK